MRMQILSGLLFYENILWFDPKVSEAEQMIFRVARLEPPPLPPVGLKLQQLCEFIDWVFGGYFADSYTEAFLRSWGIVRGIQRDPLTF